MSRASRRGRALGFTLLEVLAAVALLAILYTVLARVAIQGLRAEGENARRLEAAFLADRHLVATYDQIYQQLTIPPVGTTQTVEGDFTVTLDVTPFLPPVEWGVTDGAEVQPVIFARSPDGSGVELIRTAQVTVTWLEGVEERHVVRTVYLVDFQRTRELLTAADAARPKDEDEQAPEGEATKDGAQIPSDIDALERELGLP
jgi:prepilin-type N-terminal cleavage/methylation domain-containing protein